MLLQKEKYQKNITNHYKNNIVNKYFAFWIFVSLRIHDHESLKMKYLFTSFYSIIVSDLQYTCIYRINRKQVVRIGTEMRFLDYLMLNKSFKYLILTSTYGCTRKFFTISILSYKNENKEKSH